MKSYLLSFAFAFLGITTALHAQTIPLVLLDNVEDAYRRQQLLDKDKSNSSYMIRPLTMRDNNNLVLDQDNDAYSINSFRKAIYSNNKLKLKFYALPVILQQQVNTHHPYGINDASMVQARGYQTQISGGVYAELGPLSIQLRPEYVFAENRDFQKLSDAPNGVAWNTQVAFYYNHIDLPDRMGDGAYSKLSWGQSSIRLNAGPVSVGLSNENMWWGPGVRNSLVMTNNAPGFKHFTLNTTRPIKTYIGSFEAQVIAGKLEQSGVSAPVGPEFLEHPKDWRYLSGVIITYQPKWMPNFYLGVDRVFVVNHSEMGSGFFDYFPIFEAASKSNYDTNGGLNLEDEAARDQYISFFARYVFPQSKAEIYFEFGRNDHSYDIRDAVVEPEHSRAYVFGFRKLIALNRSNEYIQVGAEVTQLEESKTRFMRGTTSWYAHSQVVDGYTNRGQVIGAGIGSGSNLQSMDVSWVKGLKRIGLQFERKLNNNDLFYDYVYASANKDQYTNRHWVDLSIAGKFAWNYKQFILNSQLTYIRSLNYQYQWQPGESGDSRNWDKQDVNNLQLKVGVLYNW
jgi:hypothetical protein